MTEWRTYWEMPAYEVSDDGQIRSKDRVVTLDYKRATAKIVDKKFQGKLLTPYWDYKKNKKYKVSLCEYAVYKVKYVHILVATVFHPNPDNWRYVRFIDGDPRNCHKDNLEWFPRNPRDVEPFETLEQYSKRKQLTI